MENLQIMELLLPSQEFGSRYIFSTCLKQIKYLSVVESENTGISETAVRRCFQNRCY